MEDIVMKKTYLSPDIITKKLIEEFPIALSGKVDDTPAIGGGDEGGNPGQALVPYRPYKCWQRFDYDEKY